MAPTSRLIRKASALFALLALSACASKDPPPKREVPGGDASLGPQAITRYGCGTCHTIPGVEGANGRTAHPLLGFGDRADIVQVAANVPENLVLWIQRPEKLNPRTQMPNLNVTEKDARDIAAYLYTLRTE